RIVADAQGERVVRALQAAAGGLGPQPVPEPVPEPVPVSGRESGVVVVLNGSARLTDASPGPYDPRAAEFDAALDKALRTPDPGALRAADPALAAELWASTGGLPALADLLTGTERVRVDYDDAPYGVRYWVVRYER
ncbi:MAG: hypothetical protein QM638_05495, partial [Nocardioides sp.]|uniref:hypothetical protein n=1 Tax=Nocardioides sp. TaxID=35761 RepID=UPI0039E3E607